MSLSHIKRKNCGFKCPFVMYLIFKEMVLNASLQSNRQTHAVKKSKNRALKINLWLLHVWPDTNFPLNALEE